MSTPISRLYTTSESAGRRRGGAVACQLCSGRWVPSWVQAHPPTLSISPSLHLPKVQVPPICAASQQIPTQPSPHPIREAQVGPSFDPQTRTNPTQPSPPPHPQAHSRRGDPHSDPPPPRLTPNQVGDVVERLVAVFKQVPVLAVRLDGDGGLVLLVDDGGLRGRGGKG